LSKKKKHIYASFYFGKGGYIMIREIFKKIKDFFEMLGEKLANYFERLEDYENKRYMKEDKIELVQKGYKDKVTESINDKSDRMLSKLFYPYTWNELSNYEKKAVAQAYLDKLQKNLCLKNEYKVVFEELGENDYEGFDFNQNEEPRVIRLDINKYINSNDIYASLKLYNILSQEIVYGKQKEIIDGDIVVSDNALRLYNANYGEGQITANSTYFLGSKLEEQQGNGGFYISPSKSETFNEKDAFNMLQFVEREPKRFSESRISLLEKRMIADGMILSDEAIANGQEPTQRQTQIKQFFEMYHTTDYKTIREQMNQLYNCKSIEKEIDKAMLSNYMNGQIDQKPNYQVQYAVGIYQLQSQAELDGKEFDDPRRKVIEDKNGFIEEMTSKQYEKNKARLEYENIKVGKVTEDVEYDKEKSKNKKNQKSLEDKNGNSKKPHNPKIKEEKENNNNPKNNENKKETNEETINEEKIEKENIEEKNVKEENIENEPNNSEDLSEEDIKAINEEILKQLSEKDNPEDFSGFIDPAFYDDTEYETLNNYEEGYSNYDWLNPNTNDNVDFVDFDTGEPIYEDEAR
jgi:hypothetical protein